MLNPDPAKLRYLGIDLHSRTRRRVLVVATWIVFIFGIILLSGALESQPALGSHPIIRFMILLLAVMLFGALSVFESVRTPVSPIWSTRGMMSGRFVLLTNLEDRDLYKYRAPFDKLPEEQQQELLRSYRVGNYRAPAGKSKVQEMSVGEQAAALKWVVFFCFWFAWGFAGGADKLPSLAVAMIFVMIGFFANYMPQSIALWNESDLPSEDRALAEQPSS